MVLPERFELSTSPLPRECSTPELRQRDEPCRMRRLNGTGRAGAQGVWRAVLRPSGISEVWTRWRVIGHKVFMSEDKPSKPGTKASAPDPRVAALRANLAKRKGQAGARRSGKGGGKSEQAACDRLNPDHDKD